MCPFVLRFQQTRIIVSHGAYRFAKALYNKQLPCVASHTLTMRFRDAMHISTYLTYAVSFLLATIKVALFLLQHDIIYFEN